MADTTRAASFNRRRFLGLASLILGGAPVVLAACGGPAAAPTTAPSAATTAPTAKAAEPTKPAAGATTQAAPATKAPAAAAKTAKVTFANDWNSGVRNETVKFAIAEFQKVNSAITVEAQQIGGGAGTSSVGGLVETVVAQFVAGQAPDIIFGWPEMVPVWNRYLVDLTPSWQSKKADDLGIIDHPQITHFEGKRYAIDFAPASGGWYLNLTMLEKAGVPAPKDDWTWEDQLALAKKLTTPDGKQWGMWFRSTWDLDFFPFVMSNMSNPKSYFADKEETKVGYDTAEALEGFKWFVDLIQTHKVAPSPATAAGLKTAETGDLFMLGLAGMTAAWFQGTGDVVRFVKDRFEWTLMPQPRAPKNNQRWHCGQTEPIAISKDGEKRGVLEPALDFSLFLAGSDAVQNFIAAPANRPTIPVKKSTLNSPAFLQEPPKNMKLVVDQLNDAANAVNMRYPKKYWAEWMQTVNSEAERAIIGEASAEDAWKSLVEKTQRIMDANK